VAEGEHRRMLQKKHDITIEMIFNPGRDKFLL
jgi:hypothetical protein